MLMRLGVMADTFETAITWDRFAAFHESVVGATREALGEPCRVTCRFTHVYPDGAGAVLHRAGARATRRRGGAVVGDQARRVGRDHRRAAGRSPTTTRSAATTARGTTASAPTPFAAALRGAKAAVDPAGIMNPGVLLG